MQNVGSSWAFSYKLPKQLPRVPETDNVVQCLTRRKRNCVQNPRRNECWRPPTPVSCVWKTFGVCPFSVVWGVSTALLGTRPRQTLPTFQRPSNGCVAISIFSARRCLLPTTAPCCCPGFSEKEISLVGIACVRDTLFRPRLFRAVTRCAFGCGSQH